MAHAYIGFGSNIDDRFNYITQALRLLLEADGVSLIRISSLYETEPVGYEEQDWFLNGVDRCRNRSIASWVVDIAEGY